MCSAHRKCYVNIEGVCWRGSRGWGQESVSAGCRGGAGQGGGRRWAFQRGEQHEAVGRREKRTQVCRQGLVEETPGGHSHGLLAGPEGEALILGTGYSSWGHFLLSAAHLVATCILTGRPGAGVGQSGGLGSGQLAACVVTCGVGGVLLKVTASRRVASLLKCLTTMPYT